MQINLPSVKTLATMATIAIIAIGLYRTTNDMSVSVAAAASAHTAAADLAE